VREAVRGAPSDTHSLVLDAEGLTDVDSAGLDAIADLACRPRRRGDRAARRVHEDPVHERLEDADVADAVGPERFYPTVRAAVRAAASRNADPATPVLGP